MSKIYRIIFYIAVFICVFGCKVSYNASSLLMKSQKYCLKDSQNGLVDIFAAYRIARHDININQTIDSVIHSISCNKERDTIFIMETCNPPLYSYYAILWNNNHVYTLSRSGVYEGLLDENNIKQMRLIEKWDKKEIVSKSHETPLIYYGEWVNSRIASRIIMRGTNCEAVESIYFHAIDMNNKVVPVLFE